MKYYSKEQQEILNALLFQDTISVSSDNSNEAFYYLERERLIRRISLKNRVITYCLSAEGKAYLQSLAIDEERYHKPLRLSKIAIAISALSLVVSIAAVVIGLM